MKTEWFLILIMVLILAALAGCQLTSADQPAELAFKGMEMYSWKTKAGVWQYSLLPGTNRIKTIDEVTADPLDLEEIKLALEKLPPGEIVFWVLVVMGEDASVMLAFPPQTVTDEIIQHAAEAEVLIKQVCQ